MVPPVYTRKIGNSVVRQSIPESWVRWLESVYKSLDTPVLEWIIASSGLALNALYLGYKYATTGYLLGHIKDDPIQYALVFLTIPTFALFGYLIWSLRNDRRRLEESERLSALLLDLLRRDFVVSTGLMKDSVKWLKGEGPEEKRRVIDLMEKEIYGFEEAIADACKLAELLSGPKDFEYCDLGNYIENAINESKVEAEKKGIEVKSELDRTYTTWCSSTIKDAISHLISNAIKFSPEKAKVEFGVEDSGKNWKLTIRYPGALPHDYKSISARGSTGLSLVVAKKIVDLHGGKFWIKTDERGSTFCASLPKWKP